MRKSAPFRREIADDIPVSAQNVLVGAESLQPHRAARVNLAGGNADLRAEAVAIAVGKARRAVLIHPGGIHQREEFPAAASSRVMMQSVWWEPCLLMKAIASSMESTV